jgi:FkbM family methyltransferase
MNRDLIYDVGVHDGEDSAYYLCRGFRVVGIEASPVMAETLRQRFAGEIADGRYTLLNVAIVKQAGTAEFWLSDVTAWSSFDKSIASRDGTPHRAIRVPTVQFSAVIAEHGVPHYSKIDIEGHDGICISALTPEISPDYISIEMAHADGGEHLQTLRELGYRKSDHAHRGLPAVGQSARHAACLSQTGRQIRHPAHDRQVIGGNVAFCRRLVWSLRRGYPGTLDGDRCRDPNMAGLAGHRCAPQ